MRFPVCQFAFRAAAPLIVVVALLAQTAGEIRRHDVDNGIAVDLSLSFPPGPLREGDDANVRLKFTDARSGTPVGVAFPKAWMRRVGKNPPSCHTVVQQLLNADIGTRADVDFNNYYVVALNGDATIMVVDPLFGYGGSKLLAMAALPARGEDWALTPDGEHLFVTVPDAAELTVIDTRTWKVESHIPLPGRPSRVAVQPDGGYAWVTLDSTDGQPPLVFAISTSSQTPAARIETGAGQHEIAFSSDSHWAAVTNSKSGTVSLIDTAAARKVRDFRVGAEPVSIAFSPQAKMFYAADRASGTILAIDPTTAKEVATVKSEPGIIQIRFDPQGRLAFVLNPDRNRLAILDAATNHIIQSADVPHGPDQVAFSDTIGYIRCRRSESVIMVPLDGIGKGMRLSSGDFPGGQHTFGEAVHPSPADVFARAPGENAMLVANPADKAIYYYREGLPAPMGSFADEREPRAILVLDRSLKQREAGTFETTARMPEAGDYLVALLVDSPRVVQCFPIAVQPNPAISATGPRVRVEFQTPPGKFPPGKTIHVRLRLTDSDGTRPGTLTDVRVLGISESASWRLVQLARPEGDGVYGIDVTPAKGGRYHFAVECRSRNLTFNHSPQLVVDIALPDPEK